MLNYSKEKYYQLSKNSERSNKNLNGYLEDYENGLITQKELETENLKCSELKIYVEESKIEYQKIINDTNNDWNKLYSSFFPFITTINKSEQTKRGLILSKLDEFIKFKKNLFIKIDMKKQENLFRANFDKYMMQNGTSLHTRISAMCKINLSFNQNEKPVEKFVSFERFKQESKKTLKDKFILVENVQDLTQNEKINLNFIINDLYTNRMKDLKVYNKIGENEVISIFEKDQAILKFLMDSQTILTGSSYIFTISESKFNLLSKIIGFIITNTIKNDYLKLGKVEKILEIVNRVQTIKQNKKIFVFSNFENSLLWKDIDLWVNLFSKIVSKKIKNLEKNKKKKKNLFSMMSNLIKKNQKQQNNELLKWRKNILQVIVFYLQNLKIGLGLDLATEIITEIAKNNDLKTSYIASILDDFENDFILTQIQKSLNKRNNKKLSFKWKKNIGFKLAFEYLSTYKEKLNLTLASKELNKKLSPKLKKSFLITNFYHHKKRMLIWSSILSTVK